jgi:hypothetical protein
MSACCEPLAPKATLGLSRHLVVAGAGADQISDLALQADKEVSKGGTPLVRMREGSHRSFALKTNKD